MKRITRFGRGTGRTELIADTDEWFESNSVFQYSNVGGQRPGLSVRRMGTQKCYLLCSTQAIVWWSQSKYAEMQSSTLSRRNGGDSTGESENNILYF